jgi:hypothetical protein
MYSALIGSCSSREPPDREVLEEWFPDLLRDSRVEIIEGSGGDPPIVDLGRPGDGLEHAR